MANKKEATVTKVIKNLRTYLENNLTIEEGFIKGLQAENLLNATDASHFCATLSKGGNDALYHLLDHVSSFYVEETLERFCTFLDDFSMDKIRPRLGEIATDIRAEMKKHQPGAMEQTDTLQNGGIVPTVPGGEPMFTIDNRSQKIEEIVDLYRRGGNKVSLPRITELEDDFDNIIEAMSSQLSSADSQVICKLHRMMRMKYRRYVHGVKPVELPSVPNTANGLCEFITEKSTPYEILLVHHTVEVLNCEDLKRTLQSYESKLADHLRLTLGSYKKRKVTLPLRKDRTHLAVTISKDQILLSLVLHIKEYLMTCLKLEETLFEGFGEGCTVFFFSIFRIDAVLLAPKILSHSAELKRLFDITHLIVFDYFACDLERATIEIPVISQSFEQQLLMRDLKEEMLHRFDQLQTSKAAHDRRQVIAVFEKVQQELISTKKKLDVVEEGFVEAEKMLRTSTVGWSEDKVDCLMSSDKVPFSSETMSDAYRKSLYVLRPELENVLVDNIISKLHKDVGGFLDDHEEKDVMVCTTNHEKMRFLLKTLRTKSNKDFMTFCEVLESSGYHHFATKLKKKAGIKYKPSKDHELEKIHKILKEKKVAYSLHPVIKKLKAPFSTVVSEFRKQVLPLSDDLYYQVVTLCRITMAAKAHKSRIPDVPSHLDDFIDHIIKHTTFFDIELIHEVAELLQQKTLTEAVVRYEADLEPLMRTSIAELTDRCEVMSTDQDSPEGTYRLVLKFSDDANVKDLYEAKDYLEKVLHIPDAKLLAIDFGCILAYFKITCTADTLKDLPKKFTKHSNQMEAMGISGAFLIDHWAWGADSDDVWYTDDEKLSDCKEMSSQCTSQLKGERCCHELISGKISIFSILKKIREKMPRPPRIIGYLPAPLVPCSV